MPEQTPDAAPVWMYGTRLAARHAELGRTTYRCCAEAAEWALNAYEASSARGREDVRAMAVGTRETVSHFADRSFAAARDLRGRLRDLDRRGFDVLETSVARVRADCREIALRGQIAADTNVKAYFDCVEELAHVSTMRDAVAVQVSFFWDQCHRSARQMIDLHRLTMDAWRKTAFPRAA